MKILIVEEIDSTQKYLINNNIVQDGILATNQIKGIGRSGSTWLSDTGSLLFSFYYAKKNSNYKEILFALKGALLKFNIKNITVKWPNDIFINNKKVCGIIISEIDFKNEDVSLKGNEIVLNNDIYKREVVVGIGLNLSSSDFLYDTVEKLTGIKIEKIDFLREFFKELKNVKNENLKYFNKKTAFFKNKKYEIIENGNIILKNNQEEIKITVNDFSYDLKNNIFYEKK